MPQIRILSSGIPPETNMSLPKRFKATKRLMLSGMLPVHHARAIAAAYMALVRRLSCMHFFSLPRSGHCADSLRTCDREQKKDHWEKDIDSWIVVHGLHDRSTIFFLNTVDRRWKHCMILELVPPPQHENQRPHRLPSIPLFSTVLLPSAHFVPIIITVQYRSHRAEDIAQSHQQNDRPCSARCNVLHQPLPLLVFCHSAWDFAIG